MSGGQNSMIVKILSNKKTFCDSLGQMYKLMSYYLYLYYKKSKKIEEKNKNKDRKVESATTPSKILN